MLSGNFLSPISRINFALSEASGEDKLSKCCKTSCNFRSWTLYQQVLVQQTHPFGIFLKDMQLDLLWQCLLTLFLPLFCWLDKIASLLSVYSWTWSLLLVSKVKVLPVPANWFQRCLLPIPVWGLAGYHCAWCSNAQKLSVYDSVYLIVAYASPWATIYGWTSSNFNKPHFFSNALYWLHENPY